METALSNKDILHLMNGQTTVMRYDDLKHFRNIDQVMQPHGSAVILYQLGDGDVGHWTSLMYTFGEQGQPVIEFFDPYGISVDNEFTLTHSRGTRYLAKLLSKTKFPVVYNDYGVQRYGKGINTCGRHVVNRLKHADMSLDQYAAKYGPGGDAAVVKAVKVTGRGVY